MHLHTCNTINTPESYLFCDLGRVKCVNCVAAYEYCPCAHELQKKHAVFNPIHFFMCHICFLSYKVAQSRLNMEIVLVSDNFLYAVPALEESDRFLCIGPQNLWGPQNNFILNVVIKKII